MNDDDAIRDVLRDRYLMGDSGEEGVTCGGPHYPFHWTDNGTVAYYVCRVTGRLWTCGWWLEGMRREYTAGGPAEGTCTDPLAEIVGAAPPE